MPSQSSSRLLPQISATAGPGVHVPGTPAVHAATVRRHSPTPQVIAGSPSSTAPSQSSSMP